MKIPPSFVSRISNAEVLHRVGSFPLNIGLYMIISAFIHRRAFKKSYVKALHAFAIAGLSENPPEMTDEDVTLNGEYCGHTNIGRATELECNRSTLDV